MLANSLFVEELGKNKFALRCLQAMEHAVACQATVFSTIRDGMSLHSWPDLPPDLVTFNNMVDIHARKGQAGKRTWNNRQRGCQSAGQSARRFCESLRSVTCQQFSLVWAKEWSAELV